MASTTPETQSPDRAERLRSVVERCWQRLRAGERLDADAVKADHAELLPELAEELSVLFHLERARRVAHDLGAAPAGHGNDGATMTGELLPTAITPGRGLGPGAAEVSTAWVGDEGQAPPVRIAGYQILRELSAGGQGVVYEAVQQSTRRKVAVKVLRDGAQATKAARQRFAREIELIASFSHSNIVDVFEAGLTPEGQPFYAMDYIRGLPLHKYVKQNQCTLEDAVRVFLQVCAGVQYAHQRGVIHRDLKPTNILVDAEGTAKVLDFGLAKQLASGANSISDSEQIVGTLPYMAPEQTRGNPDEVDTRTDVYALGIILYEIITGKHPYPTRGSLADVLHHITSTAPLSPARCWSHESGVQRRSGRSGRRKNPISRDLETIILKALSKQRERRYQSAGELAQDLRNYLNGEPIAARRDSSLYVLHKLAIRHIYATASIVAFFALVVSFGAISVYFYLDSEDARRKQEASDTLALNQATQLAELTRGELRSQVRQMALGWFLTEWNAQRVERAREICALTAADTAERLAMEYLLDPASPSDRLLAQLAQMGPKQLPMAFFAIGERHRMAGERDEAIRAFENCTTVDGSDWVKQAARARLAELRGGATGG